MKHLIRHNITSIAGYLNKQNIDIKNTYDYITFIYKNTTIINKALITLLNNNIEISLFNQDNNIIIRIPNSTENNINREVSIELNSKIKSLINLIKISDIELSINKENNIRLYTNNYQHILDNYLLKDNYSYYFDLNKAEIESIYKEISNYNNKMKITNIKNYEYIENPDLLTIKYYYNLSSNNKLIIFNKDNQRQLIISGPSNILFKFTNSSNFDKLFLPEILKIYIDSTKEMKKEQLESQHNKAFYSLNNNFYILNFSKEIIEANTNFLHKLFNQKKYKLELNKKYLKEEFEIKDTKKNYNYSYGYVNILLIALILSVLTIIFCISRY